MPPRGVAHLAFVLALASCAEPGVPGPRPAPPAAPIAPPEPAPIACRYGLAAPEVSLTPDVADPFQSDVAWAAGRLLVVYTTYGADGYVISARLFDPAVGRLGAPMRVSPPGTHVEPRVVAVGDRFLVTWEKQATPDDPADAGVWGRWISPAAEMSPSRPLPLPIPLLTRPHLLPAKTAGQVLVTWTGASRLHRATLGADLEAVGPVIDLGSEVEASDWIAVEPAPWGGTWIGYVGAHSDRVPGRLRVLRVDDAGHELGPATEVSGPETGTVFSPALLATPEGLLAAWQNTEEAAGPWVRRLDAAGDPLEEPRPIVEARGEHLTVQLFRAPGGPVLVWGHNAGAVALSWTGAPIAEPTLLAPLGTFAARFEQKWIAGGADPWVVLTDLRHGRTERFAAPVRCGGEVPLPAPSIPVVDRRAKTPPPAPVAAKEMRCPRLVADPEQDAGAAGPGEPPRLAESGGAVILAWRGAGANPEVGPVLTRRLRRADGRFLDGAPRAGPPAAAYAVAGGTVLFEAPGGHGPAPVSALLLGAPPASARLVSDALSDAHAPVAAVSGGETGAAWLEGDARYRENAHLVFRSFDTEKGTLGPALPLALPAFGACCQHLAAAPGGFIAAWTEGVAPLPDGRSGSALRLSRLSGGRGAWATPRQAVDAWGGDPVSAIGVAGGQVYAVTRRGRDAHEVALMRWDLDGARLDDIMIDAPGLLAAVVTDAGVTALTHEDGEPPQRCLHRLGLDGRPTAAKTCTPTRAAVGSDALLWAGGALYHATLAQDEWRVRVRRFRCR